MNFMLKTEFFHSYCQYCKRAVDFDINTNMCRECEDQLEKFLPLALPNFYVINLYYMNFMDDPSQKVSFEFELIEEINEPEFNNYLRDIIIHIHYFEIQDSIHVFGAAYYICYSSKMERKETNHPVTYQCVCHVFCSEKVRRLSFEHLRCLEWKPCLSPHYYGMILGYHPYNLLFDISQ